jgi:GNAT superfamily N-acetyltransferase
MPYRIVRASSQEELSQILSLFNAYQDFLGIDLCFQDFAGECERLPGEYASPEGCLLLAFAENGEPAGCVALRKLEKGIGELKRFFVKPEHTGKGIGRALLSRIIREARDIGYKKLRLDSLRRLGYAHHLYVDYGFVEIPPYNESPMEDVFHMELELKE